MTKELITTTTTQVVTTTTTTGTCRREAKKNKNIKLLLKCTHCRVVAGEKKKIQKEEKKYCHSSRVSKGVK